MPKTKRKTKERAGKEKKKAVRPEIKKHEHLFSFRNYLVFGLGFILLVLGYFFLAQPAKDPNLTAAEGFWSLNVAPVVLILAYLVVIPVGILLKKPRGKSVQNED